MVIVLVKMIDITPKRYVLRVAKAKGRIKLRKDTIKLIKDGKIEKGDVLTVTKIVAMEAVKKTANMLPFCHPIEITHISSDIHVGEDYVEVEVTVKSVARTGVEMEALMGVCMALLNIWDMVKKYEKDETGNYPWTRITDIQVVEKVKIE